MRKTDDMVFAHQDLKDLMRRALAAERGIKVKLASKGHAHNLRTRLNTLRSKDRRQNAEIYEPDHPLHGTSTFDALSFVIEDDGTGAWLRLVKPSADDYEVQEL